MMVRKTKQGTLADVASYANVSPATVSYYFSGRKKITRATAERIQEGARKFNYTPLHNRAGGVREKIINLCIGMETVRGMDNDTYNISFMNNLMDYLQGENYQLTFTKLVYTDEESVASMIKNLNKWEGVILCNPRKDHRIEDILQKKGVPFVVFGITEKKNTVFYVDVDMPAVSFTAADFLFSRGHKKILYINLPEEWTQSQHRLEGYRLAASRYKIDVSGDDVFYANPDIDDAYIIAKKQLAKKNDYTAVLCGAEIQALGVIRAAKELKIDIPAKLELMGMGNTILGVCSTPSLTVVDFNIHDSAVQAAKLLLDIINRKRLTPFHLLLPGTLIKRDSTRP